MSWLKSTLSKVGEKAEAIKQSNAIKTLQERTSTVVTSTVKKAKEAVKGGAASVAELEAQLEQRARSTRTPAAVADLHRNWVQCLAGKEGYRVEDSDRLIGFKEVLLKSRALELVIETAAADLVLRKCYVDVPSPDDKASPAAALHGLLGKTLACPAPLWQEVLRISMSDDGPLADGQVAWITGVVSAMKLDWKEEALSGERRELALRAEYLRQEVKQLEVSIQEGVSTPTAEGGGVSIEDMHRRRVSLSAELLQTYQAVRQNLQEAQEHRKVVLEGREHALSLLTEQIQAHAVTLQSSAQTASEKHDHLECELKQSQDTIQVQLKQMDDKREEIDRQLEELEDRKRKLRIELDEVSRELDETRMTQRQQMEKSDGQRQELEKVKSGFREKIEVEDAAVKEAQREQSIVERARQLVRDTEASVQSTLGNQLEELKKKQSAFNDSFQDLLKEHLTYAERQANALRTRAEACKDSAEREQVARSAQEAKEAFENFRATYGQLLASPSASHTDLDAKVKEVEASMRELEEATSRRDKAPPPTALETPLLAPEAGPAAAESPVVGKAEPVESAVEAPADIPPAAAAAATANFDPPPRPAGNAEAKPAASALIESAADREGTNVATSASTEPSTCESSLAPTTPDVTDIGQLPASATEEAKPSPVV